MQQDFEKSPKSHSAANLPKFCIAFANLFFLNSVWSSK